MATIDTMERLQRVLAARGIGSRRKAEELIRAGRVSVDGEVVTELGTKVDARAADIVVDGKALRPQVLRYALLNKPRGYITTTSDERSRRTVMDLVPSRERIYPVGRLDRDTEGLLLLTNDGDVANRVMHPRYELAKEYHVLTLSRPNEQTLRRVRDGVVIDGRRVVPDEFRILRETREGLILKVVIHEGMNHVVRRMMETVGIALAGLRRVRLGPLALGNLPAGAWRELTAGELASLFEALRLEREDAAAQQGWRSSRRLRREVSAPGSPSATPVSVAKGRQIAPSQAGGRSGRRTPGTEELGPNRLTPTSPPARPPDPGVSPSRATGRQFRPSELTERSDRDGRPRPERRIIRGRAVGVEDGATTASPSNPQANRNRPRQGQRAGHQLRVENDAAGGQDDRGRQDRRARPADTRKRRRGEPPAPSPKRGPANDAGNGASERSTRNDRRGRVKDEPARRHAKRGEGRPGNGRERSPAQGRQRDHVKPTDGDASVEHRPVERRRRRTGKRPQPGGGD